MLKCTTTALDSICHALTPIDGPKVHGSEPTTPTLGGDMVTGRGGGGRMGTGPSFLLFLQWSYAPLPHSRIVSILWHQYDGPKVHLSWPTRMGLFCCCFSLWQCSYAPVPHSKIFSRLAHQWAGPLVHGSEPSRPGNPCGKAVEIATS